MIEKHLTLTCYTLEHPFTANYSNFDEEILDLIDSNNDVYEFKLAETELYEKIDGEGQIKQIKRIGELSFMLYRSGKFIIRRVSEELYAFNDIQQLQMIENAHGTVIILRSNRYYAKQQLQLQVGLINRPKQDQEKSLHIKIQTFNLEEELIEHDHFQKYVSQFGGQQYKIQKIMSSHCLLVDNHGQRHILRLNLQQIINNQTQKLKFKKLQFELNENYHMSNSFRDYLLIYNQNETYLVDCQHQKIVLIKDLQVQNMDFDYIIYKNFAIAVIENNLCIFETIKGNKMAEINIDNMLEQFQQGSSIIIKQQIKKNIQKEVRYELLYDNVKSKLTHFYLFDKEKLGLFCFNINKLLQRGFIKTIKENLQSLQGDEEKYHENIMKTLNFRVKKLETLEKYLLEDLKTGNFGNTTRFLINEQTIYVLNDGLSLFFHAIINNITKLMNNKQMMIQLERETVKICHRLITQSNYESQIANGLQILNSIYTNLRKFQNSQGFEKNKQVYAKVLETNRITKLLKNQKKKKLFELSYELALKVKGYKYLESLESSKNK